MNKRNLLHNPVDVDNRTKMEVHHHSGHEHGPKTWKSYASEFIMLFIAVFCGSVAEYFLEHKIESDRETEYVKAVIRDIKADTVLLNRAAKNGELLLNKYRKLSVALAARATNKVGNDSLLLAAVGGAFGSGSITYLSNSAISQLKNGGGFRLIKKDGSRNAISDYYASTESFVTLGDRFITGSENQIAVWNRIADFSLIYSRFEGDIDSADEKAANKFLIQEADHIVYNPDPKLLHELAGVALVQERKQSGMIQIYKAQQARAITTLEKLKDEYGFE